MGKAKPKATATEEIGFCATCNRVLGSDHADGDGNCCDCAPDNFEAVEGSDDLLPKSTS